jgi:hypothetical protein
MVLMTPNFDLLIAIPRLSQLIQHILAFCDNTQKVRDLLGVHIAKEIYKDQ